MKTEKNILVAFILNFSFSVFEFIGGILSGSIAIISDAIHDIGDAASIGFSYFLERKSRKEPNEKYTYGYLRFSVLGGAITTFILLFGSCIVIANAINRILNPTEINYNGMIIFAVIGVIINLCAAFFTREGDSINQKAVNLHMLEDVLGWIVVLIGAIAMKFTDFVLLDPIMSIGVAIFILINAVKSLKQILDLFLEKTPTGVEPCEIKEHLCEIDGVIDVHHIHIRSLEGNICCAELHVVVNGDTHRIKEEVRKELNSHGIAHCTIELEDKDEICHEITCRINSKIEHKHALHHHHHH